MPASETVPNNAAVIGAVASVAPTDPASVRQSQSFPSARSLHRVATSAPPSAAAESQAPGSSTAPGSSRSSRRQVTESTGTAWA